MRNVMQHRPTHGLARKIALTGAVSTAFLLMVLARPAKAADHPIKEGQDLFLSGKYDQAIARAEKALEDDTSNVEWTRLLVKNQLIVGQYGKALGIVTNGFKRYPLSSDIQLKWLAREIFFYNGYPDKAAEMLIEINRLFNTRSWAYKDAGDIITLARTALAMGADSKLVLDRLLIPAKKNSPELADVYEALGELAYEKGDFALAASYYKEGIARLPNDPDLHYGYAKSFAESDREEMAKAIDKALELNPRHVPSHLMMIDRLIDREDYEEAEGMIAEILKVNPWQPTAWAYRAVIAHLRNDSKEENKCRTTALKYYSNNPDVDHLIGRKLSAKYRFREGADYQRLSLKFAPANLPAKIQLAQDLLRLGEEYEGWELVKEVSSRDEYDVTAYNLITLRDTTAKFANVTNEHFVIRMARNEADIYGQRALALLTRAHETLTRKYQCELPRSTIVEIFPNQNDFGVRTFGMPDNPGFLGVCFGCLITANSPASQGDHPSNWEAVLWHEFTHVITLTLTKNKMPRWLSEGISVFEEKEQDRSWGQDMTPQYRELILEGELTPVSKLSSAFLSAKTDLHLQFAYYESYLAVDYIVREFGVQALRGILTDLGNGIEINRALAKHTRPIKELDKTFEKHAKTLAKNLAPGLDFTNPNPRPREGDERTRPPSPAAIAEIIQRLPKNNFYRLTETAFEALKKHEYVEAEKAITTLLEHYPNYAGPRSPLWLKAQMHQGKEEPEEESKALRRLALLDSDAVTAYQSLLHLESERGDWPAVRKTAERILAVNPLSPLPHRFLARAEEQTNRKREAVAAWETVLKFDPTDPAEVYFRIASLLQGDDDEKAKRQLLHALEEAPRYREALKLLLEMNSVQKAIPPATPAAQSSKPPASPRPATKSK